MRKTVTVLLLVGLVAGAAIANDCDVSSFFASPYEDGTIRDAILEHIRNATSIITLAVYSLTDDILTDALIAAYQSGVYIEIIADNTQAVGDGSDIQRLADAGIVVFLDTCSYAFHQKFMVVDTTTVVTGSYDWSANANDDNFENIVVIRCHDVARVFTAQFDALLTQYAFRIVAPGAEPELGPCCNYIASGNSEVFHEAGCFCIHGIPAPSRVCYCSRDEAIQCGKSPCTTCDP